MEYIITAFSFIIGAAAMWMHNDDKIKSLNKHASVLEDKIEADHEEHWERDRKRWQEFRKEKDILIEQIEVYKKKDMGNVSSIIEFQCAISAMEKHKKELQLDIVVLNEYIKKNVTLEKQ